VVQASGAPFQEKNGAEDPKIYLAMDRTQWQEHNILMVAIIIDRRALPFFNPSNSRYFIELIN
jgi:hypothetical protein